MTSVLGRRLLRRRLLRRRLRALAAALAGDSAGCRRRCGPVSPLEAIGPVLQRRPAAECWNRALFSAGLVVADPCRRLRPDSAKPFRVLAVGDHLCSDALVGARQAALKRRSAAGRSRCRGFVECTIRWPSSRSYRRRTLWVQAVAHQRPRSEISPSILPVRAIRFRRSTTRRPTDRAWSIIGERATCQPCPARRGLSV